MGLGGKDDFSEWHHLQLTNNLESDGNEEVGCWLCKQPVLGSHSYKCGECNFFLHESCLEPIDKIEIKATHNLSDRHHLISKKVLDINGENKYFCSMCEEPIPCLLGDNEPPIYKCSIPNCSFLLHQPCAELPLSTTCPLHFSGHPLYLKPPVESQYCCGACGKLFSRRFFYKCSKCNYRLEIKCAARWQITADKCNQHAFIPTRNPIQYTCEACGGKGSDIAYLCSNCRILIHSNCAQFHGNIKIEGHRHSLTCTFSLSQGKKYKCEVCCENVDTKYAAYCCDDHKCDYIAHLWCAYRIRKLSETNDSIDYATHLVKGNDLKEDIIHDPQELKHLGHPQHKLILKNEALVNVKCCKGCMQFIVLPPFYDCVQCNFSLHLICAKLPSEVMRPLHHQHPLTLHNVDSIQRLFYCWDCDRRRSGFSYICGKDSCCLEFDAQCILIPEVFKHEGHDHSLILGRFYQPKCSACGRSPYGAKTFDCTTCEFRLCIKCATLPLVTRHRYDTHLLLLTNTAEDDSGEYYCQICEEERNGKHWFYYCKSCNFAAHPQCILGKTWLN